MCNQESLTDLVKRIKEEDQASDKVVLNSLMEKLVERTKVIRSITIQEYTDPEYKNNLGPALDSQLISLLYDCIKDYDSKRASFETYYEFCCKFKIKDYFTSHVISISNDMRRWVNIYDYANAIFFMTNGRHPSDEEIVNIMKGYGKINVEKLDAIRKAKAAISIMNVEDFRTKEGEACIDEFLSGVTASTLTETKVIERERVEAVHKALNDLSEEDRRLIVLCFWTNLSANEIAKYMGYSSAVIVGRKKERILFKLGKSHYISRSLLEDII